MAVWVVWEFNEQKMKFLTKVFNYLISKKEESVNEKLSFLADHFMKIYERQMIDFDVFDRKISWFIIFQVPLFQYFISNDKLFIASLLFLSIVIGIYIVFPKKVRNAYSPEKILNNYWKENSSIKIESAQAQMVVDISIAILENFKILNVKSKMSKYMIFTFILAIFISFLTQFDSNTLFYKL